MTHSRWLTCHAPPEKPSKVAQRQRELLRTRLARRLLGTVAVGALAGMSMACSPANSAPAGDADAVRTCGALTTPQGIEAARSASGADQEMMDRLVAACQGASSDTNMYDSLRAVMDSAAPTPASLASVQQTFPVTDEQGYTFDLTVDFALRSVTADPSGEAPGRTAAARDISLEMSIANTTTARNLSFREVSGITSPLDLPTFLLSAVYEEGDPVCTLVIETQRNCSWFLAYGRMESGITIPAGGTYDLTIGASPNGGGYPATLLGNIPEDAWAEVQASLAAPDGYKIVYSGGDGARFTPACGSDTLAPPIVWTATCIG
ncbi:hypothetical protein [Microbacterium enclense]|uniref:hypothetical protein n=1 Tax=Microbacterium enclense TaxID=993073 RepID=UPI003419853C